MNKQTKKKLELQLQTAIEGILTKQDSRAATKSRKTVRQASKAVVKKFNKAVKSLEEKNDAQKPKKIKSKKKSQSKKSQLKNLTGETARIRRSYSKEPVVPPIEMPEPLSSETPRTENL